jgi:putative Mg2+ transporter-C (MgtC) family protein
MAVAVCSGATIGYLRRERRGMMRTMAMVSLGSATFTLNALIGLPHSDPGRTTAAIISGVGFLGAGVITQPVTVMEGRRGNDFTDTRAEAVSGEQRTELQIRPVYGLTTAAAIWMSAAMGIACGAGRLTIALGGTVLTLLILKFKLPWAKKDNPFITFTTKRSS